MDRPILQDLLTRFNESYTPGKKKVALLLDNASSHIWIDMVDKLKVMRVNALPPNTTAKFQFMDFGIIQSFKIQYKKDL